MKKRKLIISISLSLVIIAMVLGIIGKTQNSFDEIWIYFLVIVGALIANLYEVFKK